MSKPWGGIGSWAAEAEREEAEERENATTTAAAANTQSFPSLKEAITAKPKKKKMTLSEFASYGSKSGPVSSGSTRLTPDEMLQLPTAPKPRSGDEPSGPRLGGGFSSYGDDRRGSQRRGFDDDRRQNRREFDSMPPPPSRADEVDNWASMKKPISMADSGRGGGGSRYGALGGGSRADEVDNWSFGKKPQSSGLSMGGGRSSTFGSGFRDSGSDWRRGGGERELGGGGERELGRTKLVLDPPTGRNGENVAKTTIPASTETVSKANPFGAARPREEVLAEKGLDWKKLDSEIEAKKVVAGGSRPTSSQGSRPTSSQSNRGTESLGGGGLGEIKPKPKVNPFGDAKPRELLLEQKGLDWRKIDLQLEHRRVDRPETEEEKALKEEIENLKKELEKEPDNDAPQETEGEQTSLRDLIKSKESDLETLTRELDDKVRFGQKAVERPGSRHGSRPGSGAGRFTNYPERPPSQSGSFDNGRVPEVMDRPRSRGTGDVWTRPGEDRRGGFQGGRDRGGFLGNRDFDRSTSRERW
ncbi:eukaryotic translation initiation factor 4B2-like [Chenopodium quinoa]|uniref:Uncharacterized protein n=1 Tax=Chenopodium quinoa TaxID=63459 RepID=A0A803L0W0_CHEQI|nr:eukaryotic translation initiation factor 4B2-like [Chenopodium quinoa]